MPPESEPEFERLQREFDALQAAYPALEPLAALVLLTMRQQAGTKRKSNTALLARSLGAEHALIRRAAADLEAAGLITAEPVGGASPALRLTLHGMPDSRR